MQCRIGCVCAKVPQRGQVCRMKRKMTKRQAGWCRQEVSSPVQDRHREAERSSSGACVQSTEESPRCMVGRKKAEMR